MTKCHVFREVGIGASAPFRVAVESINIHNKICRNSELNQGHRDFQSLALPTELLRHILFSYLYLSIENNSTISKISYFARQQIFFGVNGVKYSIATFIIIHTDFLESRTFFIVHSEPRTM